MTTGEKFDLWIAAIPEDQYAPCPCGCGLKWKFAKKDSAKHEANFMRNLENGCEHQFSVAHIADNHWTCIKCGFMKSR